MRCTFYRPAVLNTEEFDNIVGKLAYDLYCLETKQYGEWDICHYIRRLCGQAQPLEKNPAMSFFGFAAPQSMPSDSRVVYFYRPTYIATAFMMKAVLLYPGLLDEAAFRNSDLDTPEKTVKETLAACMLGCTGRNFDGAGMLPRRECFGIFEDAGAEAFIEKYPDICPEFNKLYQETKAFLASGKPDPSEEWYNHYR